MKQIILLIITISCFSSNIIAKEIIAVVIQKSRKLSEFHKESLKNMVSNAFVKSGNYKSVDAETMDKLLQDEVDIALIRGDEDKLEEIQKKYKIDVLINVDAKIESQKNIGQYFTASSTVTISCRRGIDKFNESTSEPQTGFGGMPEWIARTKESAEQMAMRAALSTVFSDIGVAELKLPMPERIKIDLLLLSSQPKDTFSTLTTGNNVGAEMITNLKKTLGSKQKIVVSQLDKGKRLIAVGLLKVDLDIQRGRRTDTSEFRIFDYRKKRNIREVILPRDFAGIRRPSSRKIVGFSFAPGGRFVAVITKHPVLMVYDILDGSIIYQKKLDVNPNKIIFSDNGKYLKINSSSFFSSSTQYYEIKDVNNKVE